MKKMISKDKDSKGILAIIDTEFEIQQREKKFENKLERM